MFKQIYNKLSDNEKIHPQFDHIFLSEIELLNMISIVVLFIFIHTI